MDYVDKYIEENKLSIENILKYVDSYSLYSFYIGVELEMNIKYSSPLRQDDDPSFCLYYSRYKEDLIMFKDHALNIYGGIMKFLSYFMGTLENPAPLNTVLRQINHDFQLGLNGVESYDKEEFKPKEFYKKPLKKAPIDIEVTYKRVESKKYLDFWKRYDISLKTRMLYYIYEVDTVHFLNDSYHKVKAPRTLTISYEILGKYKIYKPYESKKDKFRNNFSETFVEGAIQLKFEKDFVIITKSTKECAFFREHFDWDTVAGKSETTMLSQHFINTILFKNYKYVLIWLDNDEAGLKAQAKYLELYPDLIPVLMDTKPKLKDPTDLYHDTKLRGGNTLDTLKFINNLIQEKINGRIKNREY